MPIRIITGYSPQEMSPHSQEFYCRLEEEIENSLNSGCGTIIEMDFNAKLGPEYIKGDKDKMSSNGKLLKNIIVRHNMVIVNDTDKCTDFEVLSDILHKVQEKLP